MHYGDAYDKYTALDPDNDTEFLPDPSQPEAANKGELLRTKWVFPAVQMHM